MKHLARIAALIATLAAAGCISNAEVAPVSAAAVTESAPIYSQMHAAIPVSRRDGNVFEYN